MAQTIDSMDDSASGFDIMGWDVEELGLCTKSETICEDITDMALGYMTLFQDQFCYCATVVIRCDAVYSREPMVRIQPHVDVYGGIKQTLKTQGLTWYDVWTQATLRPPFRIMSSRHMAGNLRASECMSYCRTKAPPFKIVVQHYGSCIALETILGSFLTSKGAR